jgi:repressor LexA
MGLTARQQEIYDYILEHLGRTGLPPTRAQIVTQFKFASPNAAQCHLKALERHGVIELISKAARGIRPTDPAYGHQPMVTLPIIGRVSAGQPILAVAHQQGQMTVEPRQFRPQPHFLLKVVGDSMIDAGIYENDLLVVHKTPEARSGQIVVARIDEEITVKELQRKGRRVELLAHNANYQPIVINPNQEFAIEGLAVGLIRSYSNAPTPLR